MVSYQPSLWEPYLEYEEQVVQDIPSPVPFDLPMVLIKPPEACSTAEVYKWKHHILLRAPFSVDSGVVRGQTDRDATGAYEKANFITRTENQWYTEPSSSNTTSFADQSSYSA
ncbi:hypothetical protein Tco_1025207 [Tanacetum coccineum]